MKKTRRDLITTLMLLSLFACQKKSPLSVEQQARQEMENYLHSHRQIGQQIDLGNLSLKDLKKFNEKEIERIKILRDVHTEGLEEVSVSFNPPLQKKSNQCGVFQADVTEIFSNPNKSRKIRVENAVRFTCKSHSPGHEADFQVELIDIPRAGFQE